MKRRHFIQIVNTLGFGSVLPAPDATTQAARCLVELTNSAMVNAKGVRNGFRVGVVGVGGAGGQILRAIAGTLPDNCRTVAINTDANSLRRLKADRKIRISDIQDELVRSGFSRQVVVRRFARSAIPEIAEAVAGLDMVFLLAGMGGVAGTVISPIVAQVTREQDIFTLGLPLLPFSFEGLRRNETARCGVRELGRHTHSSLPISSEVMAQEAGDGATMNDCWNQTAMVFRQIYRTVTNSVAANSNMSVDFEKVRSIVSHQGYSAFGYGSASGPNRTEAAVCKAIEHPLLGQRSLQQASSVLIAVEAAPQSPGLDEKKVIISHLRKILAPEASVIYSATPELTGSNDLRVSVLVSGIRDARALMGKNPLRHV